MNNCILDNALSAEDIKRLRSAMGQSSSNGLVDGFPSLQNSSTALRAISASDSFPVLSVLPESPLFVVKVEGQPDQKLHFDATHDANSGIWLFDVSLFR